MEVDDLIFTDHSLIHFDLNLLSRLYETETSNVKENKRVKTNDGNQLRIGDNHYSRINEIFHNKTSNGESNPDLIRYKTFNPIVNRRLVFQNKFPFTLPDLSSIFGDNNYEYSTSNIKLAFTMDNQLLGIKNKQVGKVKPQMICSFNFMGTSEDQDLLATLRSEIGLFNLNLTKASNCLFFEGPLVSFTFNTKNNTITTEINYKIFYGTYVNQTISPHISHKIKQAFIRNITPDPIMNSWENQDLIPVDIYESVSPQLFYNSMSNNALQRESVNDPFDLPELETNLLKFQRKTVNWLLEKESMKYNRNTNRCEPINTVGVDLVQQIIAYLTNKPVDTEVLDKTVLTVLNRLCFGWQKVVFRNKSNFWYNDYNGNLIDSQTIYQFILNYFNSKEASCPNQLPGQGLLAEEMGLGKTVEVTALILMNPRPTSQIDEITHIQLKAYGDLKPVMKAKTTLIVAPDSILKQWVDEVTRLAPSLAVTIYNGLDKYPKLENNARLIADYLRMFDIVFTTYSVISRELDYALYSSKNNLTRSSHKRTAAQASMGSNSGDDNPVYDHDALLKDYRSMFQLSMLSKKPKIANERSDEDQKDTDYEKVLQDEIHLAMTHNKLPDIYHSHDYQSPLMLLQFWRVLLDEVQMVSSKISRSFQSASLIPRHHSWGVSGTPIKKNLDDLHSVLTFLRYQPFCGELAKSSWDLITRNWRGNKDFCMLWSQVGLRHTKGMVHDDIQLPPQHRILMTIPFNPVEQENYNQLLEDCLATVCLDANGNPVLDDWEPTPTIMAFMRSWLVRLRQVCCNPQIGQLNISTRRYKSKSYLYTGKLVQTVQALKTLDNVLDDMLSTASNDIINLERKLVQNYLDLAQLLEFILFPGQSLKCFEYVSIVCQIMIGRYNALLEKSLKALEDLEPNNKVKIKEEEDLDNSPGRETQELEREFLKHDEQAKNLRQRLRMWNITLHKCYFLLGSCFFQLYDEEYQQKIGNLKKDVPNIDKRVDNLVKQSFNHSAVNNLLVGSTMDVPIVNFETLRESGDFERDSLDEFKHMEQNYYGLAENLRLQLLHSSIAHVDKSVDSRIKNREYFGSEKGKFVDDGSILLPKSTKKFFKRIPYVSIDDIGGYVGGTKSRSYYIKLKSLSDQLNTHTEVVNEWMSNLIEILSRPVLSHDKDPNGEEYEKSIEDQDKASCYLHLLSTLLIDRGEVINGPENSTKVVNVKKQEQQKQFDMELERVNNKEFLHYLEDVRINVKPKSKTSLDDLVRELKDIESDLDGEEFSGSESSRVELEIFNAIGERIRNIFDNQKLAQVLFQKELQGTCNFVFNARVDYFKQLQQVSDSVKMPSFNLDIEDLDTDRAAQLISNFERGKATTETKLERSISKYRYLQSLTAPESSMEDGEEALMCIICRSPITIGSLTMCGHRYCKDCLEQWLSSLRNCPMCKTTITHSTVYNFTHYKPNLKANEVTKESKDKNKDLFSIYKHMDNSIAHDIQLIELKNSYSSKVDMIVKQVLYLKSKDPKVQIVVFSQWQDLLYILATAFKTANISYLASYGTLTSEVGVGRKRSKFDSVEQFKDPENDITCFLLNARAQASGLTLINASHIFLCEPLVNTSLELQAISRIHRIGQTNVTTVWMFAIENTVEESIVLLSTNKRLQYINGDAENLEKNRSRTSTPMVDKISQAKDLSKAESMTLMKSGGIDTLVNKGTGEGETVSNDDLWNAFFCATASKETSKAMNLESMSKIQ